MGLGLGPVDGRGRGTFLVPSLPLALCGPNVREPRKTRLLLALRVLPLPGVVSSVSSPVSPDLEDQGVKSPLPTKRTRCVVGVTGSSAGSDP